MTDAEAVDEFTSMYVDCRGAGLRALDDWLNGWRPKSPDDRHQAIGRFLESLSENQRSEIQRSFQYFLDLSFFNLLVRLEHGEGPWRFLLALRNSETEESSELVGTAADRDLRGEFLGAVETARSDGRA